MAVDAAYTWHFTPGDLTFSASLAWRDKQLATLFNRFYDTSPSWYDVDLRALWKGPKDKYEIIAFVKNLTDTLQYTVAGGGAGLAGSATCVCTNETNAYELNPPRSYGVEVRYKFF